MSKWRHRGFTLVEIALTMTLSAVMLVIIFQLAVLAIDLQTERTSAGEVTHEVSRAVFRFSREARALQGATNVVVATANEFRFIAVGGTDVRYWKSGTNFMRNNQVLAEGITSLTFTYVDEAGAAIAIPAVSPAETNIRLVEMTTTVSSDTGRTASYRTAARFRNTL